MGRGTGTGCQSRAGRTTRAGAATGAGAARGAGTSVAGNAVGRGVVLDFSRHLGRVLSVDPEARTAVVEPGTVHAVLQRAVAPHGVRFGPDPSTHPRCTIGGMIGNNACGSRAMGYGRTVDNVRALDVVLGTGEVATLAPGSTSRAGDELAALGDAHLGLIRTEFGRFGRQVSGYALEHLLPERFSAPAFVAGSEGTLGLLTSATVDLVPDPPATVLVVLGFGSIGKLGEVGGVAYLAHIGGALTGLAIAFWQQGRARAVALRNREAWFSRD